MLRLEILGEENWDEENERFVYPNRFFVKLEHSLVSLSKWETKFGKPFLTEDEKTGEEIMSYIECMILDEDDPSSVMPFLNQEHVNKIQEHIDNKQTATWFNDNSQKRNTQTITNELVYYWMSVAGLSIDHQYWHLNRLFTLLRVHSAQQEAANNAGKKKKFTAADAANRAAENKRRQEMYQSKG